MARGKKTRVGVEISSTGVRVAAVSADRLTDGMAIVSRLGFSPLEPNAVTGGVIRQPSLVALALEEALEAAGVSRKGYVVGVSGPGVNVGRLRLPVAGFSDPAERQMAVRNEVVKLGIALPGSTTSSDLLMVPYINDQVENAEGVVQDDISVALVAPEPVNLLRKITMGLLPKSEPRAIDIAPAALARALVRVPPDDRTTLALVDIGRTSTTVVFLTGNGIDSVSYLGTGGHTLTRSVQQVINSSIEEAEDLKRNLRVGFDTGPNVVQMVDYYGTGVSTVQLQDEVAEVQRALESEVKGLTRQVVKMIESSPVMPSQVKLVGGGALLAGLTDVLQDALGIPVTISTPWARLEPNRHNLPYFVENDPRKGNEDPYTLLTFATAIGLALWDGGKGGAR